MADVDRHSKTEEPTQKRRRDARRKGDIAVSRDLINGVGLLVATGTLLFLGKSVSDELRTMIVNQLTHVVTTELTPATLSIMAQNTMASMSSLVGALILGVMIAHVGMAAVQAGIQISFEPLKPDWNRINPVSGMGRLFSGASLMRGILGSVKIAILLAIIYFAIRQQLHQIGAASLQALPVATGLAWDMVIRTSLIISVALVVAGAADYAFQRWRHENQLRMTKQEVKDERKEDEGDPQVKARIKRVQRELSQQRMLRDVATSTVVLTNPTHYAIALKYDVDSMRAPKVTAKGVDEVALRIRELAAENDVPILERPELARALYRTAEVGEDIPQALFKAIAEIIAYLYRIGQFRPSR